jgi:hypothetical protein
MAKSNWLNKQLDNASSVVRSWSEWKRETIRSQIADVGTSVRSGLLGASRQTSGADSGKDNVRPVDARRL